MFKADGRRRSAGNDAIYIGLPGYKSGDEHGMMQDFHRILGGAERVSKICGDEIQDVRASGSQAIDDLAGRELVRIPCYRGRSGLVDVRDVRRLLVRDDEVHTAAAKAIDRSSDASRSGDTGIIPYGRIAAMRAASLEFHADVKAERLPLIRIIAGIDEGNGESEDGRLPARKRAQRDFSAIREEMSQRIVKEGSAAPDYREVQEATEIVVIEDIDGFSG